MQYLNSLEVIHNVKLDKKRGVPHARHSIRHHSCERVCNVVQQEASRHDCVLPVGEVQSSEMETRLPVLEEHQQGEHRADK